MSPSLISGLIGGLAWVWVNRGELFAVIALIAGTASGAGYCFAEYFLTRGSYDDNGIDFYTPGTGRKTERWSDPTRSEFSRMLSGHGGILALLEQRGTLIDP